MLIPTPQDISKIIEKVKALDKAKSTFWKNEAKRTKPAHEKNLDDLSVDELLEKLGDAYTHDKPKSLNGLLGAVVRAAVKGESIPKQFTPKKGKPLSLEDYIGGVKVYFIKGIPAFPTSVLQGLLEQVITPLYKDKEIRVIDQQDIRTEEGRRLDELRDAVRFELKRRSERKRNEKKQESLIGELTTTITEINILGNGWPQKIQHLIDEIETLFFPWWDYLKANGSWGANEREVIETALKSTKPRKPKYSANVIHELEKIRHKMEIESKKKNEPQEKAGQGSGAEDRNRGAKKTSEPQEELIRDQVFICYSHKDKRWLDELQIHLKPSVRNGSITAWSDRQISPGSKWFQDIKMALSCTRVAVLLVTPNFLASDFIHEHELTPLSKQAEKGNVHIIWIPVRACSYKETTLKDYKAAINPQKPLAKIKKADRDEAWVRICEEIKKAVNR